MVPQSVPAGDPNAGRVIDSNPQRAPLLDPGTVVKLTVGVASTSPTDTVAPSTHCPVRFHHLLSVSPVLPDALGGGLSSGHRGTWPVAGVIAFAFGCILLFGFSPTFESRPRHCGWEAVRGFGPSDHWRHSGRNVSAAVQEVRLRGEVEFDYSSTVKRGLVISQDPPPASTLDRGGKVTLVVSRGPQIITVIDFVQMEEKAAEKKAKRMGLAPSVSREKSRDRTEGNHHWPRPSGGCDCPRGPGHRVSSLPRTSVVAGIPETAGLSIEGAAFVSVLPGF